MKASHPLQHKSPTTYKMIPITAADRTELLSWNDDYFNDRYEILKKDIKRLTQSLVDRPPSHPYDMEYYERTEELNEALMWKSFYKQVKRERKAIRTPPLRTSCVPSWDNIC
jgi:hypothetical protein